MQIQVSRSPERRYKTANGIEELCTRVDLRIVRTAALLVGVVGLLVAPTVQAETAQRGTTGASSSAPRGERRIRTLSQIRTGPVLAGQSGLELAVRDNEGKTRYYVVPHWRSGHLLKVLDGNKQVLFERKGRVKMGRASLK